MKKRMSGALAAGFVLAAVFAGGVAPATAAESTPQGVSSADDTDASARCTAGWRYQPTARTSNTLTKIGPTHSSHNGTGAAATMTLTSTVSGTVSASWTGSANVSGSVKLVSISGTYSINAQASVTATVGNSISITVPAGKTGNGDYGGSSRMRV